MTAWHSIFSTDEKYGPGKLSRDDEKEYWSQMAIVAQFQPIDLEGIHRTRGEVQVYLDSWREKFSASEAAVHNIPEILGPFKNAFVDLPKPLLTVAGKIPRLVMWIVSRIWSRAERYIALAILGIPAETPKVYTPEVIRRMFGSPKTPSEQREELLVLRAEGKGKKAYSHNHGDTILEFKNAESLENTEEKLGSDGYKLG